MATRQTIAFTDSRQPIRNPVTKFGGQPVWLGEPQWPISLSLERPMRFIGQISIPGELFPNAAGEMAYIFMTDTDDYVDGTWEPNGGENAVIIQPAESVAPPPVPVRPVATGPTLQRYVETLFSKRPQPKDVELKVDLTSGDEPAFIPASEKQDHSDEENEKHSEALQGNKIGGSPGFIQFDEYPDTDSVWRLLLQLDSCSVPFYVNFGDAGVAYTFVNDDVTVGRFLWQCA